MLFTTIHQISEELKRRNDPDGRSRSYSYAQIREGLQAVAIALVLVPVVNGGIGVDAVGGGQRRTLAGRFSPPQHFPRDGPPVKVPRV